MSAHPSQYGIHVCAPIFCSDSTTLQPAAFPTCRSFYGVRERFSLFGVNTGWERASRTFHLIDASHGSNRFKKEVRMTHKSILSMGVFILGSAVFVAESVFLAGGDALAGSDSLSKADRLVDEQSEAVIDQGRQIFRFDTFGDEAWWGDTLRLHQAIAGAANGGVGPGVSPKTALAVGLKVDSGALPAQLKGQIRAGRVNLDDPATTVALLRLNAVVGVTGIFDRAGNIKSMGIQCAL